MGVALREFDHLRYPQSQDPGERETARLLHEAPSRWADVADTLLGCAARLRAMGRPVQAALYLDDVVGRTRTMLQVTAEDMDEAREQVRRGEVYTAEELRRELRARLHHA